MYGALGPLLLLKTVKKLIGSSVEQGTLANRWALEPIILPT